MKLRALAALNIKKRDLYIFYDTDWAERCS